MKPCQLLNTRTYQYFRGAHYYHSTRCDSTENMNLHQQGYKNFQTGIVKYLYGIAQVSTRKI